MMKKGKPIGKYIIYKGGVKAKEGIAKPPKVQYKLSRSPLNNNILGTLCVIIFVLYD